MTDSEIRSLRETCMVRLAYVLGHLGDWLCRLAWRWHTRYANPWTANEAERQPDEPDNVEEWLS